MVRALVIDLLPRIDGPAEGRLIKSAMQNIGWEVRLVEKPAKDQAIDALYGGWTADVIHISAHGLSDRISTARGNISFDEIRERFRQSLADDDTWLDKTCLLVNSSCRGASRRWQQFAIEELGVGNYVAPEGSPSITEGIIFPLGFYLELWGRSLTRRSIVRAYIRAFHRYFDEVPWQLFPEPKSSPHHTRRRRPSDWN